MRADEDRSRAAASAVAVARARSTRRLGACLALLALVPWPAPAKPATLASRIDAAVARHVSADGPGAVVAVVRNGEVVHLKAYGLADLEEETPLQVNDNFDLASCSKQFTATCIMILADRGALSFSDDIREYFPELPVWSKERRVTIDDLLHMQAGLPEYDTDDTSLATRKDFLAWLAGQELAFPTGARFEYTNTNYVLLGLIVEQVSKVSLGSFMHDEIFEPLGMAGTVFYGDEGQEIPRRVYGYAEDEEGEPVASVSDGPGTGDGNVFSSARDLVIWAAAQEEGTLVEDETLARQVTPGEVDAEEGSEYGYGLYVDEYAGSKRYSHDGAWYGTSTCYARHPDDGLTVIVLSNLEDAAVPIGEAVTDVVLDTGSGQERAARRRGPETRRRTQGTPRR